MNKLLDPQFCAKLERLHVVTRGRIRGMQAGTRKSSQLGSSLEFADYRTYFPGDDIRLIDWNAYARLGKWFLKTYLDERKTDFQLYIDISQSMDHPNMSKKEVALRLAAALGYIALVQGEPVRVFPFRKEIASTLSFLKGRKDISRFFSFLEKIDFSGEGDFNQAVMHRKEAPKYDGVSFVITDALFPSGMEQGLTYITGVSRQVYLLHLTTDMERNPAYIGDLRLIDCESEEQKEVVITTAVLKKYRQTFQHFVQTLKEYCFQRGIIYVSIPVEEELEQILFVRLRRAGVIQ